MIFVQLGLTGLGALGETQEAVFHVVPLVLPEVTLTIQYLVQRAVCAPHALVVKQVITGQVALEQILGRVQNVPRVPLDIIVLDAQESTLEAVYHARPAQAVFSGPDALESTLEFVKIVLIVAMDSIILVARPVTTGILAVCHVLDVHIPITDLPVQEQILGPVNHACYALLTRTKLDSDALLIGRAHVLHALPVTPGSSITGVGLALKG